MIRFIPALAVAACMALFGPEPAHAEVASRADEALKTAEAAREQRLPDLLFTRSDGHKMRLSEFRGRPLLVTMVYAGCADVCPTLIANLYPAVEVAQETFGRDAFSLITVGFDVKQDTPAQMRSLARKHGVDLPNWHFLSGDRATIDALAKAVGFSIYARAGGFDHLAQVSVVDKSGQVYRQVYGASFEAPHLVEPLKNLIFGREDPLTSLSDVIDRIKLFCTTYDPNTGRYYFNYSLFIGIAIGLASLSLVLMVIVREWRRPAGGGHA